MTGEDLLHPMLMEGADGGIIASARVCGRAFSAPAGALAAWRAVSHPCIRRAEPGADQALAMAHRLDDSPEVRLPMLQVSEHLAARIARGGWLQTVDHGMTAAESGHDLTVLLGFA